MKKRGFALVLALLLLAHGCALADGLHLDYIRTHHSALYGEAMRFQSYAYDYPGYVCADGMGYAPYNGDDEEFIRIITKSASVWSEPRTNSKKLGSVSNGEELDCVIWDGDAATEGDFFVVEYKGNIGFVNQAYAVRSPMEIVLMESNVPAYIAPDSSAKCVGSLSKHTRYTVIGMYDDYYIINLRGAAAAYISKETKCYDSRFEKYYLAMPTQMGTIIRKTQLRTGPGWEYAEVADVKPGEQFKFYDMIDGWYMLRYTPKGGEPVFVFVYCNDVDVPIGNG